jgi:hypothetical protein
MRTDARREVTVIPGPNGAPLSLRNLPSSKTTRWVSQRKAEVVAAVHGGLLSMEEACLKCGLTREEFFAWERAFERLGVAGLKATAVQKYRPSRRSDSSSVPGKFSAAQ